jgi:hypothetical protein
VSAFAAPLAAQELEPRLYSNVPTGLNFLVAGYAASSGSVLIDPSIELDDAKLDIDATVLGYARSLAVGGKLGKLDAVVGHACAVGSAAYGGERVARDVCGATDARLRLAVNFVGAPALAVSEFGRPPEDFAVGASLQLSAPVGAYDSSRLVNIGSNRWAAKMELGFWRTLRLWTVEGALAATVFEDNDAFFGGNRREQEPLYALQLHVVRSFRSGIWLAVDGTHYAGGRTTVAAELNHDRQANSRLGLTVAVPINHRQSIKLYASRGVATRTGSDFDTLGCAWQYRWGGGF